MRTSSSRAKILGYVFLYENLCLIENEEQRLKAGREAYRILRPGGVALFSFLSWEARKSRLGYLFYLYYLGCLRKIRRSNKAIQYLPWLRLSGKFNYNALMDRGPYVYWFKIEEACGFLENAGFKITAIGSTYQINEGKMCESFKMLSDKKIEGMLYVVCTK